MADYVGCSPPTITRIESAQSGARVGDVARMLEIYGIDGAEKEALLLVAREARQRGWWQRYSSALPEWFSTYVGLEAEADSIRGYDLEVVPGLFQTEDYMRALLSIAVEPVEPEEVDRRVEVRQKRQQDALEGDLPPKMWHVVNEAALRRRVGSPQVHRDQLDHLRSLSRRPALTIQVLPFDADIPVQGGAFKILGFDEPSDPDIVYIEYGTGSLYLEEPDELATYTLVFDHLRAAALSPAKSLAMLSEIAATLR